jgi:hypothetical protein
MQCNFTIILQCNVTPQLVDGVFFVQTLGFPPPEARADTLRNFDNLAFAGLPLKASDREAEERLLRAAQREGRDDQVGEAQSQIQPMTFTQPESENKLITLGYVNYYLHMLSSAHSSIINFMVTVLIIVLSDVHLDKARVMDIKHLLF